MATMTTTATDVRSDSSTPYGDETRLQYDNSNNTTLIESFDSEGALLAKS